MDEKPFLLYFFIESERSDEFVDLFVHISAVLYEKIPVDERIVAY